MAQVWYKYMSGWPTSLRCKTQVLVFARRDNIRAEGVNRDFPKTIIDRVTYFDFIEFTMIDFNIILGMDWIYKCYATIDYRNSVIMFQLPNELELRWKGCCSNQTSQIVSTLKPIRCYLRDT